MRTVSVLASMLLAVAMGIAQTATPESPGQGSRATDAAPERNAKTGAEQGKAPSPESQPTGGNAPNANATSTSDQRIEQELRAHFAHKAEFQNLQFTVAGGVVTLEGSVPTKLERQRAKQLARSIAGVKKVKERVSITGAGVVGTGTMAAQNTAGSIAGNTQAQAGTAAGNSASSQTSSTSAAPSLNPETHPGAAQSGTSGGVSGAAVGNTADSAKAPKQDVARSSSDAVGPTGADSAALANNIRAAMKSDPTLADSNIAVNVTDDTIELSGALENGKKKVTAMRIAQSYAGNRKVVDRLTVARK